MYIWVGFWLVGVIWGSSFLLIRVGVETLHPLHLVFIRVGIAAIGLCLVTILSRKQIPRDWKTLRAMFIVGMGNIIAPFLLITWGEQTVESGLASVLQATAALFGLVVAHFAFKDERITPQKITGLIMGFLGVVVLASRNWQDGQIVTGGLLGQLAIVGASLCYATFTTYSRKIIQGQVEPIVVSSLAMLSAALVVGAMIVVGSALGWMPLSIPVDTPSRNFFAVILLGIINTFIAYLIYYSIVKRLGVARATMVTYVVPVVGLTLGVLLLNEQLDWQILFGAALIFTGIGVVNLRPFQRLNRLRLLTVSK